MGISSFGMVSFQKGDVKIIIARNVATLSDIYIPTLMIGPPGGSRTHIMCRLKGGAKAVMDTGGNNLYAKPMRGDPQCSNGT